jgi:Family of unknown function (DUF5906)
MPTLQDKDSQLESRNANIQARMDLLRDLATYNGLQDPQHPNHLPQISSEDDMLERFNRRFVFVISEGEVVDLNTGNRMTVTEFEKIAYRDVYIYPTREGRKPEKAATVWLNKVDKNKATTYTYEPGEPQLYEGQFNLWTPFPLEPVPGDVTPWKQLIDYVFQRLDPRYKRYFEQWCAWPFKYPKRGKTSVATLIHGGQGIGKGLIGDTLLMLYGLDFNKPAENCNAGLVTNTIFQKSFNKWAEGKTFVMLDEIRVDRKEAQLQADKFKGLITGKVVPIEGKGANPITYPNHLNMYITSNHVDSLPIEDDDRRWFIVGSVAPKMTDTPEGSGLRDTFVLWRDGVSDPEERDRLKSLGVDAGGHLAELLWYFQNEVDFSGFDPHGDPPLTEAKRDMQQHAPDYILWLKALKEDPSTIPYRLVASADLWDLYTKDNPDSKLTPDAISKAMGALKFERVNKGNSVLTDGGTKQKRLWDLGGDARYSDWKGADLGKAYDAEREITISRTAVRNITTS